MEPTLQKRRTSDDGWVLSPTGATVEDAVSSADCTTGANRQRLEAKGFIVLTKHNRNDAPSDYKAEVPPLEICQKVVKRVAKRKEKKLVELEAELVLAKEEPLADLPPSDRSYWRVRLKDLEQAVQKVKGDDCTGEELYRAFRRENAVVKNSEIDAATKQTIDSYEEVRAETAQLAEEDGLNSAWGDEDEDEEGTADKFPSEVTDNL